MFDEEYKKAINNAIDILDEALGNIEEALDEYVGDNEYESSYYHKEEDDNYIEAIKQIENLKEQISYLEDLLK